MIVPSSPLEALRRQAVRLVLILLWLQVGLITIIT